MMEFTTTPPILSKALDNWPKIKDAYELEILEPIDIILALHILEDSSKDVYKEAMALCHLSLAARSGHCCIKIKENNILPDPLIDWNFAPNDAPNLIKEGFISLQSQWPEKYSLALSFYENSLYFQRIWYFETACSELFDFHQKITPSLKLNQDQFEAAIHSNAKLLPEQIDAIRKIQHHTITFITGGPGTGKTFTAGNLIQAIWDSLNPDKKDNFELALAAPTGKAASHLHQSIASKLKNEQIAITASTLHTLLNISSYNKEFNTKLSHDLILIDESSMIDIRLMVALLKALKPGSRLILLGDHRQLPPVEPGAPFFDMIKFRNKQTDESLHPAFLSKCMRAELKDIVNVADAINRGDMNATLQTLENDKSPAKGKILPTPQHFASSINELAAMFPALVCNGEYPDPQSLKAFKVLTPLKKGLWGVDSVNNALHRNLMSKVPPGTDPAVPIILIANNHQLKLFNGEVGFLWKDYAYFLLPEGTWRKVPASIIPKYQYGYCLSIHKSQGSEFDRIVVLVPQGTETLGRSVLYTAVTRARQSLEIWYDPTTLEATLAQDQPRISNLSKRISSIG